MKIEKENHPIYVLRLDQDEFDELWMLFRHLHADYLYFTKKADFKYVDEYFMTISKMSDALNDARRRMKGE